MPLVKDLLLLLADVAAGAPSEWEDAAAWKAQKREEDTSEETLHVAALELMAELVSVLSEGADKQQADAASGPRPSRGGPLIFYVYLVCL